MHRGRWTIGGKHIEHMLYNPIPFLYRTPKPRQKRWGWSTYKYWWSLGTIPSGRMINYRIDEFNKYYIAAHVPEDVEDWLTALQEHPLDIIDAQLESFIAGLENTGDTVPASERERPRKWKRSVMPNAEQIAKPLLKALEEFEVEVPVVAVRAVANSPKYKKLVLDEVYQWKEELQEYKSSYHLRKLLSLGHGDEAHDNENIIGAEQEEAPSLGNIGNGEGNIGGRSSMIQRSESPTILHHDDHGGFKEDNLSMTKSGGAETSSFLVPSSSSSKNNDASKNANEVHTMYNYHRPFSRQKDIDQLAWNPEAMKGVLLGDKQRLLPPQGDADSKYLTAYYARKKQEEEKEKRGGRNSMMMDNLYFPRPRRMAVTGNSDKGENVKSDAKDVDAQTTNAAKQNILEAGTPLSSPLQNTTVGITAGDTDDSAVALSSNEDDVVSPFQISPNETAPDERSLIRILTLFAEACTTEFTNKNPEALSLVKSSLQFAHDPVTASCVHANIAAASNKLARYREAAYHAQQAIKLAEHPLGYAQYAVSLCYQDEYDYALEIISEGLDLYGKDEEVLSHCYTTLVRHIGGKESLREAMRGKRNQHVGPQNEKSSVDVLMQGIEKAKGMKFDNELNGAWFRARYWSAPNVVPAYAQPDYLTQNFDSAALWKTQGNR